MQIDVIWTLVIAILTFLFGVITTLLSKIVDKYYERKEKESKAYDCVVSRMADTVNLNKLIVHPKTPIDFAVSLYEKAKEVSLTSEEKYRWAEKMVDDKMREYINKFKKIETEMIKYTAKSQRAKYIELVTALELITGAAKRYADEQYKKQK